MPHGCARAGRMTGCLWMAIAIMGAATAATAADTLAVELPEVVITGSRTAASTAQSTLPVQVLDTADLERTGVDAIGTILQALPMNTGAPMNSNINNSGDGSTRIDLRGVGPSRTLVLLNGRRLMNGGLGGDESVDLTELPLSWIERVDVLTSGASAIYGADAVSGVINFVTKHDMQGVDIGASYDSSERGDGQIAKFNLSGGFVSDGASLLMGGEFVKQDGVTLDRRGYSAVPLAYAGADGSKVFLGSGTIPNGRFDISGDNALGLAPGNYTRVPGSTGQTAADYRLYTPADAFNYAPYNYLQTPQERDSLWLQGTQRLTERIELFVEAMGNRRQSAQLLAPSPYSTGSTGAPLLADGSVGIPANNYYNPFGIDLTDVRRRFIEADDRGFDETVDTGRVVLGVRGELPNWQWEVSLQGSRSTAIQHERGRLIASRYANAFGASGVNSAGVVVCGTPNPTTSIVPDANIIAGCVPTDLFGGVGTVSPAQLAYLAPELTNRGVNAEQIADATLRGQWGQLPAGTIAWSAGVQFRRESGGNDQDPLAIAGAADDLVTDVPSGTFSTRDIYAETRIPLLTQQPLVDEMVLDAGVRHARYSTFGSNTTWQAGLLWKPVSSVSVRANYARVFRVPSISDLYQSDALQFATFDRDPCGNGPTPRQRVVCAAHGVPGGSYIQADDDEYASVQGGNFKLTPERGYNLGASLEFAPVAAPGLAASLDYYRIVLNGAIEAPFAGDVLNACADTGAAGVCSLVSRHADGSIAQVSAIEQNFGRLSTGGMDARVNWRPHSVPALSLGLTATYLAVYDAVFSPGSQPFRGAGSLSLPHWRALGHADWQSGAWSAGYQLQYIGGYRDCSTFDDGSFFCNQVKAIAYHDLSAGYTLRFGLQLRAAVSNLLDTYPPFVNFGTNANTDGANYRLLGRSYWLSFRYRWA